MSRIPPFADFNWSAEGVSLCFIQIRHGNVLACCGCFLAEAREPQLDVDIWPRFTATTHVVKCQGHLERGWLEDDSDDEGADAAR